MISRCTAGEWNRRWRSRDPGACCRTAGEVGGWRPSGKIGLRRRIAGGAGSPITKHMIERGGAVGPRSWPRDPDVVATPSEPTRKRPRCGAPPRRERILAVSLSLSLSLKVLLCVLTIGRHSASCTADRSSSARLLMALGLGVCDLPQEAHAMRLSVPFQVRHFSLRILLLTLVIGALLSPRAAHADMPRVSVRIATSTAGGAPSCTGATWESTWRFSKTKPSRRQPPKPEPGGVVAARWPIDCDACLEVEHAVRSVPTAAGLYDRYAGVDLFCAGHSTLADGTLLVPGGADSGGSGNGEKGVSRYDPAGMTWLSPAPSSMASRALLSDQHDAGRRNRAQLRGPGIPTAHHLRRHGCREWRAR